MTARGGVPARGERGATGAVVVAALGLLAAAFAADRAWFDRHIGLPWYLVPPYGRWLVGRGAAVLVGLLLLVLARRIGRGLAAVARRVDAVTAVLCLLALVAAVPVAEGVLRLVNPPARGPGNSGYELKIGRRDPRYGWRALPGRTTELTISGRTFRYAVNQFGVRARTDRDEPHFDRPALIIGGESIASGYGLDYDDGFAARAGRALGLEVIDVAEGGYGADQALLRVSDLLPQVRQPVAVVMTFVPVQLSRALRDDRGHLALEESGLLAFHPAAAGFLERWRLANLFRHRLAYLDDGELARALVVTRAVLREGDRAARARGARPLYVIPLLGPPRALDAHPEAWIVRALFVDTGLPHVVVDLGPGDVIPRDGHPNEVGAQRLAAAIVSTLSGGTPDTLGKPMKEDANRHVLGWGDVTVEVDAATGGRVTALRLAGRNLLTSPEVDAGNYGSTFWTSPQATWGWPPVPEIDHAPYEAVALQDAVEMKSRPSPVLGVSVDKRVAVDARRGVVRFDFSIRNRGKETVQMAPWQITRVAPGGLTFFPTGEGAFPPSNLAVREALGVTWYAYDAAAVTDHQKLFADGREGWLAHVDGDALLVKIFGAVPRARQAPGEAQIELYANPAHTYVEVEAQGPLETIAPGAASAWRIDWLVRRLPPGLPVAAGSAALVEHVRALVAAAAD